MWVRLPDLPALLICLQEVTCIDSLPAWPSPYPPRQQAAPAWHPTPEVPDPGGAVLPACVHPAAVLMEAHRRNVLVDPVVADDGVGVIGVEVIHAYVLVT